MILSAVRPTAAMSEVSAADCFSLSAAGKGVSSLHRLTLIVQAWRDVSLSRCQAFRQFDARAGRVEHEGDFQPDLRHFAVR
jgi:hypothetical protein